MKKMIINGDISNPIEFDLFSQRLYYDSDVDMRIKSDLSIEVQASSASINDFTPYLGVEITSISLLNDDDVEYEHFTEYKKLDSVYRSSNNSTNNFILQFN